MSIDHFAYYVPKAVFNDEVAFLLSSMKHLGIVELVRIPGMDYLVGLGKAPKAFLWLSGDDSAPKGDGSKAVAHIAIAAEDRAGVDEFHKAGLAAGGKDNGAPGIRPIYHPGYYGAFVYTPAGINLEVVFHDHSAMQAK